MREGVVLATRTPYVQQRKQGFFPPSGEKFRGPPEAAPNTKKPQKISGFSVSQGWEPGSEPARAVIAVISAVAVAATVHIPVVATAAVGVPHVGG